MTLCENIDSFRDFSEKSQTTLAQLVSYSEEMDRALAFLREWLPYLDEEVQKFELLRAANISSKDPEAIATREAAMDHRLQDMENYLDLEQVREAYTRLEVLANRALVAISELRTNEYLQE